MSHADFEVRSTWDGRPLAKDEYARVGVDVLPSSGRLKLTVEATYYGDPPPQGARGSTDRLWEYEVVEIFLLGDDDRYLEIELGPHGHFLGLLLAGRRQVVEEGISLEFDASVERSRWRGEARIDLEWLPTPLRAANFYAIHGEGLARRHLAAYPVPGAEPDFHRLEYFGPLRID